MTSPFSQRPTVMVVDDNAANLDLLEEMLQKQNYQVQSFPLGRLALAAADREPPDLILLDVNMPEMDGYEVCERLKANERLAGIPVIFLSALGSTADKVKGFRAGGADYISKPFQFEEAQARVDTHLKLRRAMQAERELLERTLGGAVGTLLELIQLSSPALVLRSSSIRDIVLWIANGIGVRDVWSYELAARLSLLGCMALPNELFEKAYCGYELTAYEAQKFRAHPETGAGLLCRIPRLELVAEMIRMQQTPDADMSLEEARTGARMLNLALALDRRIYLVLEEDPRLLYREIPIGAEVAHLRSLGRFDAGMLRALESYRAPKMEMQVRSVLISEVRSGMVLDEDVWSKDGKLAIFRKGIVFNPIWIERLGVFAASRGIKDRVRVLVPSVDVRANLQVIQSIRAERRIAQTPTDETTEVAVSQERDPSPPLPSPNPVPVLPPPALRPRVEPDKIAAKPVVAAEKKKPGPPEVSRVDTYG